MNGREIKLRVCSPCPEREGTQDDPDYIMTFCMRWLPACPYFKGRAAETFVVEVSGENVIIPDLGVSIPKPAIDAYINHIIDRLRGRVVQEYQKENLLLRVEELEEIRRDLHQDLKRHLKYDPFSVDTEIVTIQVLIEHFLESRIKRFV